MVFLDIEMAEVSGLAVAEGLAGSADAGPAVVFVTAHERYARQAFDVRAIDYLMKPFEEERFGATLDRVRAHARAARWEAERRRAPPEVLRFADLSLDTGTRQASRNDRTISLTAKEYELLELFMRHPRQVLTRDMIFDRVWGYDFGGESNIIEVYIRYLRQKLEGEGEPRLIHTVRGVGYVLRENP